MSGSEMRISAVALIQRLPSWLAQLPTKHGGVWDREHSDASPVVTARESRRAITLHNEWHLTDLQCCTIDGRRCVVLVLDGGQRENAPEEDERE